MNPNPGPGFAVLYRWRLHPGQEASFVDAWSRVSDGLLRQRGSLGSRLHQGSDGLWYSYAQWPSAEARAAAFEQPPVDEEASARMQQAVAERWPELVLNSVADFLQPVGAHPAPAAATGSLTLFGLPRSVYTRIVRLVLEEKGLPYHLHEVEIFGPAGVPADHLGRHPFGRIPVLAHDELMLYETAAIARYVDETFEGPSLQPATARDRARMAQIVGLLDAYAYRPMVWGVFVPWRQAAAAGAVADDAQLAPALAPSRQALGALAALAGQAPWLAGDTLSLADLHAYPMLRCLELVPAGAQAIAEHPALAAWLSRMRTRESVRRTVTVYEARPA